MKVSALYRQWLILKMIPPRKVVSTTLLHERLAAEFGIEVSLRTIQRDLVSLESNEFPLQCDGNNPAGWSWRKDAPAFNISNMDPVTALTFKLAEKHLERMFPRGAMAALEPYFTAARERSKLTTESTLSRWPDKVKVLSRNLPIIYPQVDEGIMDKVYTAVLKERRFNATYRTIEGAIKEYEVNPLGLAFVEGLTYLVATLFSYENPVLLLLHRMQDVRPGDQPVTIPDGFNLDEYTTRELKFPFGADVKLKVLFSDRHDSDRLLETPVSEDQIITEKRGRWQLQATMSDSWQLRWWLRGYGERVEVVSPKKLRDEFAGMAQKTAAMYGTVA